MFLANKIANRLVLCTVIALGLSACARVPMAPKTVKENSFSFLFQVAVGDCIGWVSTSEKTPVHTKWVPLKKETRRHESRRNITIYSGFAWKDQPLAMSRYERIRKKKREDDFRTCDVFPISPGQTLYPPFDEFNYSRNVDFTKAVNGTKVFAEATEWLKASGFTEIEQRKSRRKSKYIHVHDRRQFRGCVGKYPVSVSLSHLRSKQTKQYGWYASVTRSYSRRGTCES